MILETVKITCKIWDGIQLLIFWEITIECWVVELYIVFCFTGSGCRRPRYNKANAVGKRRRIYETIRVYGCSGKNEKVGLSYFNYIIY